ncbi:MAG TPA: BTAD domain-containing putative transcriptional regulator, partial [Trueperaceae bacterium]
MSAWQLKVLGDGALVRDGVRLELERKTAALLTYLALDGASSRSRLAGLLWPESPEATARNNLSQVLRRLRKSTGTSLVLGGDVLALTNELEVDAACFKLAAFEGRPEEIAGTSTELLCHYDYGDCLDFDDWLLSERESLGALKRSALVTQIERLSGEGRFGEALVWAEALLELDPISEEAHRDVMRLHYLAGDRAAALQAYARCRAVLQRELGVGPLDDTRLLAEEIERGAVTPTVAPQPRRSIPLMIQRPPVLVGRERAWARMEEAWERGQAILVCGPPGAGKTRLVRDFAAAKGHYLYCQGRPGDEGIPFASLVRSLRRILVEQPDLELAPWVRFELSRILPELAEGMPPPQAGEEEKLRFYDAQGELFRLAGDKLALTVADDVHLYDPGSLEASTYLGSKFSPAGHARFIEAFRTDEVSPALKAYVDRLTGSGAAVLVALEPLAPADVAELVDSLDLPAEGLAAPLARYTGGNPLFIVETLKSLYESGELGGPASGGQVQALRFPRSGRVTSLIGQRLERLSGDALRLCWTAAVAGEDFGLDLAAHVLETGPMELAGAYQELEDRHILLQGRFSHDLLQETALAAVPAPIKAHLHGRIAARLSEQASAPAGIARHYLAAGREDEAAPFLVEAAQAAKNAYQLQEAAALYGRAAAIFERRGRQEAAFDAMAELAVLVLYYSLEGDGEALVGRLAELARGPAQEARVYHARALLLLSQGRSEAAEEASLAGYLCARQATDLSLQAKLLSSRAEARFALGQIEGAAEDFLAACQLCEQAGEDADLASALSNVAVVLDLQDRYEEAAAYYRRADDLSLKLGDTGGRIIILNNYGFSLREAGRARLSLEPLEKAKELLEEAPGSLEDLRRNWGQLGESYGQLGAYAQALDCLHKSIEVSRDHELPHGFLLVSLAKVHLMLGDYERCAALLDAALEQPAIRRRSRGAIWLVRARLQALLGAPMTEALERAAECLDLDNNLSGCGRFQVVAALAQERREALEGLRSVLRLAVERDLGELCIGLHARSAQLLLSLGRPAEALEHSAEAVLLLERYDPLDFYRAEVLFAHYQALAGVGHAEAPCWLERAHAWIMGIADRHVPDEFRRSFLEINPVNRAVLEAAREAHLP